MKKPFITSCARGTLRYIVLTVISVFLFACGKEKSEQGAQPQMPPTPVSVAQVVEKNLRQWAEFSGRFEAVNRVAIRPRVTG